jgi:flagellar protein FliL
MAKSDTSKSSGGLIGVVIVTVLAAGAGVGFGFLLSSQLSAAVEAEPAEKPKPVAKPSIPEGATLVHLKPLVANLAHPKDAWLRMEASLILNEDVEGVSALSLQVADDVVAYLRTTTLAQFESASGFQNLSDDLNDRLRIRAGKDVGEFAIHGLVIE